MAHSVSERREAWISIAIFLILVTVMSAVAHYAIVELRRPTQLYVGPLMWSPAVAAFLTLWIRGRKISSMPWKWAKTRFNIGAYLWPVLYISAAYGAIWALGFGDVPDPENMTQWAQELGMPDLNTPMVITLMVAIVATLGVIRALSTIVGEEIGWRGFFIWELRKVMPFGGIVLFSGIIWSAWHWPIVITYGGGDPFIQVTNFTVMIVAMSSIMTYYTFKSNSMWPAILFHGAHNVYSDKIFRLLSTSTEGTAVWGGEFGFMIPIMASVVGIYFWRRAKAEGM